MFRLKPGDLLIIPPAIMHHPIFRDFEIPYERYVLWLSPLAFDTMKKIDPDIDYFLRPGHAKTFLIRDSVDSSRARFGQFEALTHAYREESLCYHSEGMADILRILIGINRSFKKNYGVNPREYVAYHMKAIYGEVGGSSLDIDHQSTES